jgi:hypothetical protein
VLKHLQDLGSLSGLEATALYRVSSLTKVISVLRRFGWRIIPEWKYDHTGKRYVRYYLHTSQLSTPLEDVYGP